MKKVLFIVLILAVICVAYYVFKIEKRKSMKVPDGAVSLEFPLKDGSFQAIQSGPNGSTHTQPPEKYALDITKQVKLIDFFKFRQSGLESNPTFGTPVYSPCNGNVEKVINDFPDMPIGTRGNEIEANRVLINCGQFNVMIVHFQKGSILVKVGDIVTVGQQIGLIGNSGASDFPHLHLMAYKPGPNLDDKTPLPMIFNGKYLFRGDIYP